MVRFLVEGSYFGGESCCEVSLFTSIISFGQPGLFSYISIEYMVLDRSYVFFGIVKYFKYK